MKTLIGIGEGSAYFLEKFFKMVNLEVMQCIGGSCLLDHIRLANPNAQNTLLCYKAYLGCLDSQRAFDATLRTVQQLGDCSQG